MDRFWRPGQTLEDVQVAVIRDALAYHGGNRSATARALGVSKEKLIIWIRRKAELKHLRQPRPPQLSGTPAP